MSLSFVDQDENAFICDFQLALAPTLTLIPAVRRGIEPLLPG